MQSSGILYLVLKTYNKTQNEETVAQKTTGGSGSLERLL